MSAQRQHDADLVESLRITARWVMHRSGKVALLLATAAERIEELSARLAQLDPPPHPDPDQIKSSPRRHRLSIER